MCVRGVEEEAVAGDAELASGAGGYFIRDFGGEADEVGGDDHDAPAGTVVDRQSSGPQRLEDGFGRAVAVRVTGHPDGTVRCDVEAGDAGSKAGGRQDCLPHTQQECGF
jgi:hypothetical protein